MWEAIKDIGSLLYKAGNSELYKQLLDFQAEAQKHIEENIKLKEEIKELREQMQTAGELEFRDNQYFRMIDGKIQGPFCSCCWDRDHILINLHKTTYGYSDCPSCKTRIHNNEKSDIDEYNEGIKEYLGW
jgi:hypothetical protein